MLTSRRSGFRFGAGVEDGLLVVDGVVAEVEAVEGEGFAQRQDDLKEVRRFVVKRNGELGPEAGDGLGGPLERGHFGPFDVEFPAPTAFNVHSLFVRVYGNGALFPCALPMTHPTQVFLSNPQALRVEFRLDDATLRLWWSPLAGRSTDYRDRNYSHRDCHLDVFEEITVEGVELAQCTGCDYDPYHTVLHFGARALHLAIAADVAALRVWSDGELAINLKAACHNETQTADREAFVTRQTETRYAFDFAAVLGEGAGGLRFSPVQGEGEPTFVRAELAAEQALAIGVGLAEERVAACLAPVVKQDNATFLAAVDTMLAPHEATGHTVSARYPELAELRRRVLRGLHSMIDESGAYRASLKAIYYLIWVRDGGFSFAYQAAAGWPHKLPEFSRLLRDNPVSVQDEGYPPTRMFGQLINRVYGKLEEDGLFYVVWTLFTAWTQTGRLDWAAADWDLLDEALAWVEAVTWDEARGLFGEHFADETPTLGHRDAQWDFAIGKPTGGEVMQHDGQAVTRNYDVYFNLLMHSTYTMLAALAGDGEKARGYAEKAARGWPALEKLLHTRKDGIPAYAEVLREDGGRKISPAWGEASSCCVWGLTIPNFAPLPDWDSVLAATMDQIIAEPEMHWINGIAGAMAAVDPWVYPEEKLLALHQRLAEETNRPGKFLPMGGAMPEKFNAPEGNLYHDIRPQGFAMGAWLGAWASLGVRRLPYGLALRPTTAFERLENYAWRGRTLTFHFDAQTSAHGEALALEVAGQRVPGTLQVPEDALEKAAAGQEGDAARDVRLVAAPGTIGPLWLRSTVELRGVAAVDDGERVYTFTAHGMSRITFSAPPASVALTDQQREPLPCEWTHDQGLTTLHFSAWGPVKLAIGRRLPPRTLRL